MTKEARDVVIDAVQTAYSRADTRDLTDPPNPESLDQRLDIAVRRCLGLLMWIWQSDGLAAPHDVRLGQLDDEREKVVAGLKGLRYMRGRMEDAVDAVVGVYVARGRAFGMSWKQIGESLDMTPAGVYKRARAQGWVSEWDPELEDDEKP